MSGREGRGERRGEAEEFSASLFPGLCKGLIKYGWCLEQSRGKWDSTNSTSSPGRPTPLRWSSAVSFSSSVSPSSSSPLLSSLDSFTFFPLFPPYFISSFSDLSLFHLSNAVMTKCVCFYHLACLFMSFPSTHFLSSSSAYPLPHLLFSTHPCSFPSLRSLFSPSLS